MATPRGRQERKVRSPLLLVSILGAFVDRLLERRRRVGVVDLAAPADLHALWRARIAFAGLGAVLAVIFTTQPPGCFRFFGAAALGRGFRRGGLAARTPRRLAGKARAGARCALPG